MRFNRVFTYAPPVHPSLTYLTLFWGYYNKGSTADLDTQAQYQAVVVPERLLALPPQQRVLALRWLLVYEMYTSAPHNVDPLPIFELGRVPVSRALRILRPMSRRLKEQRIRLAGVWCDTEGFLYNWSLTPAQMTAIFRSSRARANMPPRVRTLQAEFFDWRHPRFRQSVIDFNRWMFQMTMRSLRQIMSESRLFELPGDTPGTTPPLSNYLVMAPTWPVYDGHGWQHISQSIDGRTSNPPFFLPQAGVRYQQRVHEFHWNAFIDLVNIGRSCMARADMRCWPFLVAPKLFGNDWLYEQLIGHVVRTGMNASNGNNFIFYLPTPDPDQLAQETLLVDILNRHDEAFAAQRGLPEIQLDSDRVETAGFVTTYEDFLLNTPSAMAGAGVGG